VAGELFGALALVGERVFPFLIPLAFVLLARFVDGRLRRINSLSVVVLGLSVPLGVVVPMAVLGSSMGFLRYLVFPLFVAAGWGLYEIALSRRRRAVVALILSGWLVAVPAELWVMSDPGLGPEEEWELTGLFKGVEGQDAVGMRAPVASYLQARVLPDGKDVVLDSVAGGSMIAMQIRPANLRQLILTSDRRFEAALAHPGGHDVGYFLMPDPAKAPQAAIGRRYPRLWSGQHPGFRLVKTIAVPCAARVCRGQERWRIYSVAPGGHG
jgi:hypothetical protein